VEVVALVVGQLLGVLGVLGVLVVRSPLGVHLVLVDRGFQEVLAYLRVRVDLRVRVFLGLGVVVVGEEVEEEVAVVEEEGKVRGRPME